METVIIFWKVFLGTLLYFLEFSFVLKVKLNDKLIAFLFCEALLSCDYYDDAKHYYAAAMMRSIIKMQTLFFSRA